MDLMKQDSKQQQQKTAASVTAAPSMNDKQQSQHASSSNTNAAAISQGIGSDQLNSASFQLGAGVEPSHGGAQNAAVISNIIEHSQDFDLNANSSSSSEESAAISQMQYLATASAPGSLSIDTSSTVAALGNNLTHPSKGHKVATPSSAFQFATSPSIMAAAKTSSLVNYSKNANALFTASPAKSLASPTHSVASNSSSDSSVASAGVKLMVGNMILRKRESIAFFIDLLSPDSQNLKSTKYTGESHGNDDDFATTPRSPVKQAQILLPELISEEADEEEENGSSPVKGGGTIHNRPQEKTLVLENGLMEHHAPLQPPVLLGNPPQGPSPPKTAKANGNSTVIANASGKVSKKTSSGVEVFTNPNQPAQPITFPKFRSHSLRPAAKELRSHLESRLTSATLKRARLLASRSQKLIAYAQTVKVKLLIHDSRQRLEKLRMQARMEYNTSNAQLNRQVHLRGVRERFGARVEHAKRIMLIQKMKKFVELRRALSENFLDLLRLNEDDEQEDDRQHLKGSEKGVMMKKDVMEALGLALSTDQSRNQEEGGEEDYEEKYENEADKWPMPDSPQKSTTSAEAKKKFKDFSSDFLFASSPGHRESLADKIKRTKSLPDLVLKDASYDSTIQELLSLLPPITRFTLRELEMDEILSNMQLRHDIVFDPDLQFKASDADDEEAAEKTKAYWQELNQEVSEGHLYRICLLLSEVRAIMIELVPNGLEIKDEIHAHIDTNLITQQIEHGVMDPGHLIDYIAGIMKTNCAPIRDKLVDRMVEECRGGKIVKCLETCFEILELMKLDYANHQLSRLRPYIIEHSVNYEWKYFRNQVESKQITLDSTIAWLKRNWDSYKAQVVGSPNPAYDLYPEAFIEIISQAPKFADTEVLPETLKMDLTRLIAFYNSWQDVTILSTILVVFKQAAGPRCQIDNIQEAKTALWILLNDTDSTMSHISVQMASMAGKIRNHTFTAAETTALNTMTEKMLAPGSKLYELMQSRVRAHLVNGVAGQKIDVALLAKHGLQAVQKEIEDLVTKMLPIAELNRAVFGKLYAGIVEDIKQGKDAESPTVRKVVFADD